jgi:protein O-GlcNAc transferase
VQDALLQSALRAHQAGNLAEAARLYSELLRGNPRHAPALYLFGVAHVQTGQFERALSLLDNALSVQPDFAEALLFRGNALQGMQRFDEALVSYDRALALKPGFGDAENAKGVALSRLQRHSEALGCYGRVLRANPQSVEALNNYGNALIGLARFDEAIAVYDQCLALDPAHPDAMHNRGAALFSLRRFPEAVAAFDQAIALQPHNADAFAHRGFALAELGRHDAALSSFAKALEWVPGRPDIVYGSANSLLALGRLEAAIREFNIVLSADSRHVGALVNMGVTLSRLNRLEEALSYYDHALELAPQHVDARYNRANTLSALRRFAEAADDCAAVLAADPDYPYARGTLIHSRLNCCDWRDLEAHRERIAAGIRAGKRVLNPQQNVAVTYSAEDQMRCALLWAERECPAAPAPLWRGEFYRHDRIRIAYLSADFHRHATAFLMAGLFEGHDRARFETYGISFGADDGSEMRARLAAAFEHFHDVRANTDAEIAAFLREQEIDIAVDLKGYTEGARTGVFAWRPAPVQVNYLGFPGTMGAGFIDYVVADSIVIPEEEKRFYSEEVVYLPGSYQPNDAKRRISDTRPMRAESGLPENAFVFCAFNANYKFSPEMFDIWMRLLQRVEGSILWILEPNAEALANLRREAKTRGIPHDRVVLAKRAPLEDHLARHRLADLFLDTLPCCAHTTASDALWAGLPVLTCAGGTFAGRVAASLLQAVGMPELITHSLGEYEAAALRLANDPKELATLRAKLAVNRTNAPLFDTAATCRHLEAAYIGMHQRRLSGAAI